MPIATTQSDFRNHIKDYLDKVNDENQTVLIARSNPQYSLLLILVRQIARNNLNEFSDVN